MNIAEQAKRKLKINPHEFSILTEAQKLKRLADRFDEKKKADEGLKQKRSVEVRRNLEDIKLARDMGIEVEDLK